MNGILNINKEPGMTSFDVVKIVRRMLKVKKVGHTGTLDPQAKGVMVLCLGKATRIVQFLMGQDKEYHFLASLGIATDTQDSFGEEIAKKEASFITRDQVEAALDNFRGEILQLPPMVSALHYQGKRLYQWAREGKEVDRPKRQVEVKELVLLDFKEGDCPETTLRAVVSSGTYIRTLCHDLGEILGVGGHLSSLTRTRCGSFKIEESLTIKELKNVRDEDRLKEIVCPMDEALGQFPALTVKERAVRKLFNGLPLLREEVNRRDKEIEPGDYLRLYSPSGRFLAIAKASTVGQIFARPVKIFYPESAH